MTREYIDAQLKEVTYEDAMYYYTLMKNQFISDYSKAIGDESQQMANRYLNDFISEIETSQFGSVPWELTYDFLTPAAIHYLGLSIKILLFVHT